MRIFKKHDIPITFYAVGRAFERNPLVAKYAEENGHEVAAHCYKVCRITRMRLTGTSEHFLNCFPFTTHNSGITI